MYASHLCKHTFSHNRFVGRNCHTGIRFHYPTDIIQATFIDARNGMKMVLQDSLHTGQRSITSPLSQPVNGGMQSFHPTQYSCQHITYSQIIVIVRMKIKMKVWITLLHFTHEFDNLQGIENSQGVRKHETTDTAVAQTIYQTEYIVR